MRNSMSPSTVFRWLTARVLLSFGTGAAAISCAQLGSKMEWPYQSLNVSMSKTVPAYPPRNEKFTSPRAEVLSTRALMLSAW